MTGGIGELRQLTGPDPGDDEKEMAVLVLNNDRANASTSMRPKGRAVIERDRAASAALVLRPRGDEGADVDGEPVPPKRSGRSEVHTKDTPTPYLLLPYFVFSFQLLDLVNGCIQRPTSYLESLQIECRGCCAWHHEPDTAPSARRHTRTSPKIMNI